VPKPASVRWVAVVLCIVYGFAKLNGSQFTVLDSELTKPLGEVSGFWLTWYYFGYSSIYGSLIALVQIAGAILLAWPRTALLGAVALAPIFGNIILINLFFGIDLGASIAAVVILGCLVAVIAPHADRLQAVLLLDPISKRARLRLVALAVILVGAFGFTWWVANYNNRHPTAIDGIWSVVPERDDGSAGQRWQQLFFERNRAHWVTFRAVDGTDERHHFEVDEQGVVRIWQTWLTKGALIMQGRVASDGRLHLEPVEPGGNHRMVVQRQSPERGKAGGEATETRVPVDTAAIYVRTIGSGRPLIVLHGGPDFDHGYLLPELDQLKDAYRLIYYDQRGRGRSAANVRAEDVTLASDVDDLDRVRNHFRLEAPALLGHSWGAVLALEYAWRHPTRVSHLILMNPAPASAKDVTILRKSYLEKIGAEMDRQRQIVAGDAYRAGDPEAVAARYRIHFKPALKRAEDYEKLMTRMRAEFIRQGKEGILKARAVEDRLMRDTWEVADYDLTPKLRNLRIPTLVIAGDHDFIPVEVAESIARAIPNAELVTLKDCGHFAYLECSADVRKELNDFFQRTVKR
jgi:proline iminopeptidase